MTPEQFKLASDLFLRLQGEPAASLESALQSACPDDAEVREMLGVTDASPGDELGVEVAPADASSLMGDPIPSVQIPMPERVGNYRLIELLGEGGMGRVYLAEQHSPRRTVALKMMRPGAFGGDVLRRFEMEAMSLGRLDHPGVAKVYEAAVTELDGGGRVPYFAMELIREARTLTEYADDERLGTNARLELIAQVCEALGHGHVNGLIHRDLKPDNLLVDASGAVKIIDFGVARATDSDEAPVTLQTHVGQLIGTLPYMSPEQVEGDSGRIDTRSDIYGLGVVMHELLTGSLPYQVRGTSIAEAARLIRDESPVRLRSTSAAFDRDLETILLKTLAKHPSDRYQSAGELRDDLRRYLANEPVLARPPSVAYQLRKFSQRRPGLVGAIAAAVLILVVSVVTVTILYLDANRARDRERIAADAARDAQAVAELEARRVTRINDFLVQDMLNAAHSDADGHDVRVVEVLDRAAELAPERFEDDPAVAISMHLTLASTFTALGSYEAAERQAILAESLAIEIDDARSAVDAGYWHAASLMNQGKPAASEPVAQAAWDRARANLDPNSRSVLKVAKALGDALQAQNKHEAAEPLLREVLRLQRLYQAEHADDVSSTLLSLGASLGAQGRGAEAVAPIREALRLTENQGGDRSTVALAAMNNLVNALSSSGQYDEAVPIARELVEAVEVRLPEGHPGRAFSMVALGTALLRIRDLDGAASTLREAQTLTLDALGPDRFEAIQTASLLLNALEDRPEEQRAQRRIILELQLRQCAEDQRPWLLSGVQEYIDLHDGRPPDLRWHFERGEEIVPPGHPRRARYYANIARVALAMDDADFAAVAHETAAAALADSSELEKDRAIIEEVAPSG